MTKFVMRTDFFVVLKRSLVFLFKCFTLLKFLTLLFNSSPLVERNHWTKKQQVRQRRLFIMLLKTKLRKRSRYLRGVSHPVCYDDLLPAKKTNYSHVEWFSNSKPPSGSFSISKALSQNELNMIESSIISSVRNIISEADNNLES